MMVDKLVCKTVAMMDAYLVDHLVERTDVRMADMMVVMMAVL
jgi:hypothetical protein